ncbi:hypothetical protein [Microseira wollei]|uniref:hypothetical protein n=1 Tax=Microseira wollei TaxID=467598 RepID=UPI001CFEDAF4|nr:hypothetical protein [Microseira wollei]
MWGGHSARLKYFSQRSSQPSDRRFEGRAPTPTPQEFFWFCGVGILPASNIFARGLVNLAIASPF